MEFSVFIIHEIINKEETVLNAFDFYIFNYDFSISNFNLVV